MSAAPPNGPGAPGPHATGRAARSAPRRLTLGLAAGLFLACGGPELPDAGSSAGVDDALTAGCVTCHQATGRAWALPSSHHLLFDCGACHVSRGAPGSRHMATRTCDECHSQTQHHTVSCSACHDVHGAENAALVRSTLGRFRVYGGEVPDGLAHHGAGVCAGCHTATRFYRADGGEAHDGAWCVTCHSHQRGFSAAP